LKLRSTLTQADLDICKSWLKLSSDEFSERFDLLTEAEQKTLKSILETYRLDILDFALEVKTKNV
jgi:hypothetical protein